MPVKTFRSYRSPQRDEQANATRHEILRAAERLFVRDGYGAVTMKAIAGEAGVAPATLYLHFEGKAAMVRALADEIVAAPDLSVERVEAPAGVAERFLTGARIIRLLNARSWVVVEILRAWRGTDSALDALWEDWKRRHLEAVRRGVEALAASGQLRTGLTTEKATDILYALLGVDVFRALVRERGWSPDAYEAWLMACARNELLDPQLA
ncbi:MAG: TetR/AcrR family transcriptional regulator [Dehalococcoidia bacterium]